MDAGLPTGLLERYPHHRATLQRLDALDQRIDDLERRAAVRRSQRGTPGFSSVAPRARHSTSVVLPPRRLQDINPTLTEKTRENGECRRGALLGADH